VLVLASIYLRDRIELSLSYLMESGTERERERERLETNPANTIGQDRTGRQRQTNEKNEHSDEVKLSMGRKNRKKI